MSTPPPMRYRRFGRTNLQMPVFSCGGMRYQSSWKDSERDKIEAANQANLEATIRRSVELGINHIETARGYGTSEFQLGHILPKLPREKIIVQTKVGPTADPADFLKNFETSMAALKLDHVDLLGLHGINNAEVLDWSVRKGGCLDAAEALVKAGRVRHVGFSTHGPTQVIVDAINTGRFSYVNLHWYYINQTNWAAVEAATRQDMGVFIISPSDKGGKLYAPPEKFCRLTAPLSPIVFNNLFCLSHPQVHTLSVGAARPADFDEHLKTLPLLDRAAETLQPIVQRLEAELHATLGSAWLHNYLVGVPDWEHTPGQVNIRTILWLRNLVAAFDLTDYARMRYNLLGNGGHWFPGKKAEHLEGLDLAGVLAGSPYAAAIPALLADAHQRLGGDEVKRLSTD